MVRLAAAKVNEQIMNFARAMPRRVLPVYFKGSNAN